MPANNPESDICTSLAAASLSLTHGTNLFSGPLRAYVGTQIPNKAVFVWSISGSQPLNYCDGSATTQMYFPLVRVVVRGDKQDFSGTRTLARAIRDAIHDVPPSGYVSCRVRTSEPEFYGQDDDGAWLFGLDLDMIYES
jgi:hypothetical protein